MKIIAVDDERIALDGLMDVIRLVAPESELTGFEYPEDALAFVQQNSCDVAFLDVEMTGMNGVELAAQLKLYNPDINIIFATGFEEYCKQAYDLHASGYLTKPITADKVKRELGDLRHPVASSPVKRVRFQTFGNFEVFIDGRPVKFRYEKAKEILAYLVDRGTFCTNHEIMATRWDVDASDSYFRTLRKEILDVFRQYGCEDIIVQQRGKMSVLLERTECDCYEWKKGNPNALAAYRGEYMSQYSWSEFTHGAIQTGQQM